jgi:phosphohistidine phosphatase
MKTVTLLRHAKTERESPDGDFGRSLTERGRADADRMGREIREIGLQFDLVLASPARRVVETLAALPDLAPIFDRRIYNASSKELRDIVRLADDDADNVLLVGHNPGIEQLAAQLVASETEDFPTGALGEIALPIEHWRDLEDGKGRLIRFVRPKDLR